MESLLVRIISIIIRVVNQIRNFFLVSFKWGQLVIIIIFTISLCSIINKAVAGTLVSNTRRGASGSYSGIGSIEK